MKDWRWKHGMHGTPAYMAWTSMRARCLNPKRLDYVHYGGRGITIDARWLTDFVAFWEDMGPTYAAGLQLDRIDNDGHYTAANCRWVNRQTQARNRTDSVIIETPIGAMLLCDAAEKSGISHQALMYRVRAGVPASRLFEPVNRGRKFRGL